MVKKSTINLDFSKVSGPDCAPVVIMKKCESERSYILAELLNMSWKESFFPDCWKVSSVVLVFNNVGERSTAKKYQPVSLLSVVSKIFEEQYTSQKSKFSIKDFFSKCDQIRRKLRTWSHLLKKSLMENFIFCAVIGTNTRFVDHLIRYCLFSDYQFGFRYCLSTVELLICLVLLEL